MQFTAVQEKLYKELASCFAAINSSAIVMHTDLFRIRFAERGIPIQQQLADLFTLINKAAAGRTLLFPTFNYDFCRNGVYDVSNDSCQVGTFNEYVRQFYPEQRTLTPVFNYCIVNNRSFSGEAVTNPFSNESTFAEMVANKAAVSFLGATFAANTFIHFVEETVNIGYRYLKTFAGIIRQAQNERAVTLQYRVRPLVEGAVDYDWTRLAEELFQNDILFCHKIANGEILWFYAEQLLDFWQTRLKTDELYLLTPASRAKTLELYNQYGNPLTIDVLEAKTPARKG